MDKRVIFAVAGSGKTTYIVNELSLEKRSLILTYTDGNYDNISRKILAKFGGRWPNSVTLMTYFSFLYNFCYKPYFADIIHAKGIVFDNNPNIKIPQDSMRYYLSPSGLLYSNRLAFFLERANALPKIKRRIERYYDELVIDEIQDIGGRDFDFLESLMDTNVNMLFVGDFYQHTFDTSRDGNKNKFVQQAVAQIPWGHNVVLMDKLSKSEERLWYAERSAENGWSRNVLVHQIESGLYQRQVLAEKVSNFGNRLPSPQSELAAQTMKDPYIFDFIPFKADMVERDIEQALVKDVTKLLLELGTGFAFLGNQYHLNVGGDDFYIDLLFYNLNLRCYVVIELKTGEFKPEYAGQLNFYLSAVDGILKKEQDNPSIGLLLCKSKNNLVAEYSLKDMSKPIGVSAYQITSSLPEELERQLPSVEDIQKRIKGLKE